MLGSVLLGLFAARLGAVPALVAAGESPGLPSASEHVSVTVVEVPVIVRHEKQAVRGLRAADFEVRQGSRVLPIVGFEAVDLGGPVSAEPAPASPAVETLSPAARRHLLFLFDLAFSTRMGLDRSVGGAIALLDQLHPTDRVGIALYTPTGAIPLLLNFTEDRAAARQTLTSLDRLLKGEKVDTAKEGADPLRLKGLAPGELVTQGSLYDQQTGIAFALSEVGPTAGGKNGWLMANKLNHFNIATRSEIEEFQRSHARDMAAGLTEMAESLRGVEGRKHLFFFSQGFDLGMTTPGQNVADPSASSVLRPFTRAMAELRRSGWILDSVDANGLNNLNARRDGLFYLADQAGGRLIIGNDLAPGLAESLAAEEVAYVLSVDVGELDADGAFHGLDVRAPGAPAGSRVEHRPGYFAPEAGDRQGEGRRAADAAQLLTSHRDRDDLAILAATLPASAAAGGARVPVVVEVPGEQLVEERATAVSSGRQAVEIYGYAFANGRSAQSHFATTVVLDSARVGDRLAHGGVRFLGQLDLPSGDYELRLLVRSLPSGRASLRVLRLVVDGATVSSAGTGTQMLFLPPEDDRWIVARQEGAEFSLHGRSLVPALSGVLPAGGEARLLLVGRELSGPGASLGGQVLTAAGAPAGAGGFEPLTVSPGEGGELDLVIAALRAGELAPGDYVLETRRRLPGQVSMQRTAFRVAAPQP